MKQLKMVGFQEPKKSDELQDQKATVAVNPQKSLKLPPINQKPTAYILIDVSVVSRAVELPGAVGAHIEFNPLLFGMLNIFKLHTDFDFKIFLIGEREYIEKIDVTVRENNDSKSQAVMASQLSEIEKTFQVYGAVEFLIFDVQTGNMQCLEKLIRTKMSGDIKPQQLFCFSNDATFLHAFKAYGGVAVRFTRAGEINHYYLEGIRKKFSAIDNKDYKVVKAFCDIDDTALLRPLTWLQRKTTINYLLPVAELKRYKFEWEVLTARQYFVDDIDFRAAQQQFINGIAELFSDFNGLLTKIEEWIGNVNRFLNDKQLHFDERLAIASCHGDIADIKALIADFAPTIDNEDYYKAVAEFLINYYINLQKLIGLCDNLILKINRTELQNEYDLIKKNFDAINISAKLLKLDSVICHLSYSVAKLVHKFHEEWGCELQVKKYSYTNFGQLGKKFQIIKQALLAEHPDLGKNSQKALAVFFDDNPDEFNPAISAKDDLLLAGIELIVVPIYNEGEFYDYLPEPQQKELVTNFLRGVGKVYNDANEADKENCYSRAKDVTLFQVVAAPANGKKEDGKQLADDAKHGAKDFKTSPPAAAPLGNYG